LLLCDDCDLDFEVEFASTVLQDDFIFLRVMRVGVMNNYQYFVRLNKHFAFSLLYTRKTVGKACEQRRSLGQKTSARA
jgi:hypothetical protein